MGNGHNERRLGTPSFEEWKQEWRSTGADTAVTDEEFDRVYRLFSKLLSTCGTVGYRDGSDFYFRGDNYGDRTQYLEIVKPVTLMLELVANLQKWLNEPRFKQWRIMIVTYVSDAATIMVYPSAVRVGKEYGDDFASALARIAKEMIRRDEEKNTRESADRKGFPAP